MFVDRGDGTRVRIPHEVEAAGDAAVAAFVVAPPAEAISATEPEPVPAEVVTEHRKVLALAAQHGIDLPAAAVATGPHGCWCMADIAGLLPSAESSPPAPATTKRGRSTPTPQEG